MSRKMKDSGIEWIGEIPEDWEVRKLGNISNLYTGNSIKDNEKDNYNSSINSIPYIATKDVGFDNRIDYENGMYIKKQDIKFKRAYKDNTLICIEGGSAGRKIAKVEDKEVCFGNKLCCINSNVVFNKYLYYYSLSPNFSNGFQSRITGLIPGVTLLEMGQIEVIIPPQSKQKSIADFLDKKTLEIDNIIFKTKAAIKEYKKYKQSLITETVTKGLDKNVPMKDSGIEWIGNIPEHWEVVRLKHITSKLTDGAHISPETDEGKHYFISTVDIEDGDINFEDSLKTSEKSYQYMVRTGCKATYNDILMSKDGTIGKMALVRTDIDFVVSSSLLLISSNKYSFIEFIYYYLMSLIGEAQIESYHKGSGLKRISINNTGNIIFTLPPIKEQEEIANYLDDKCGQIDNIISTKEKLLIEMESYKKSLIYETVTGKREVV